MASHEMPATIVPADPADYPLIENPAWFRVQDVTCSCGERPGREYPEDGLQEAEDSRPWCTEVIPENFRAVEFCSGRRRAFLCPAMERRGIKRTERLVSARWA